jgi:hypothetical protein
LFQELWIVSGFVCWHCSQARSFDVLLVSDLRRLRLTVSALSVVTLSLLIVEGVAAQSTDIRFSTPVRTNEVVGRIAARDIGDARLTDHFYQFAGNPGDLLVTVESRNLNGDFDVFTAAELRPLMKTTVYAETGSPVTRSIYLRRRESLILRVEARSPNDDVGSYQIRFSGSFEPIVGGPAEESEARTPEPSVTASAKRGTRVSSVGARIEEPAGELAAAPTPGPTPEMTETGKAAPAKTARVRRPVTRRIPTKLPAKETAKRAGEVTNENTAGADAAKEAAKERAGENETIPAETPVPGNAKSTGEKKPAANKAAKTASKPPPVSRSTARRSSPTRPPPKPAVEPAPETGPRLLIEVKDGTRIEHFMSSVRRVTVENGQVVVVGKDGKVERVPMAKVVQMSIGP